MPKFKHFETESGNIVMTAEFDGYNIGERLLEGLMFQITIQPDGTLKASVLEEDEEYFSEMNTIKWLKRAEIFASENGEDFLQDPISKENCYLISDEVNAQTQQIGSSIIKTPVSSIINTPEPVKEEPEVRVPIIGEFTPKRKFLFFVSAANSAKIRFLRDVAFVKGEKLSGILEGIIFKITICDEGTINFEEIDTHVCDKDMIQRLIDDIDDTDVTGYAQKFVVNGIEFNDINGDRCYLEVEHQKPIDRLRSLFEDEIEEVKEVVNEISERGLSFLDQLFDQTLESDEIKEVIPEVHEINKESTSVKSHIVQKTENFMEEQFRKMNEAKIDELKSRVDSKKRDVLSHKMSITQAESNVKKSSDELSVLESRLESMYPGDEPNGFVFYVSDIKKNEIEGLDETTRHIADKIADVMGLKKDVLFDMLTGGFYTIKIARKEDITGDLVPKATGENSEVSESRMTKLEDILHKIKSIDFGKVEMKVINEFEYRGNLNWHQLVDKMIRLGFEQEPEFDKLCLSNSYESKEEKKESCGSGCGCSNKKESCDCDGNCGDDCKCTDEDYEEFDEQIEEVKEEFKESYGYEMGNDFIFSIAEDVNPEPGYGKFILAINPKSHWDNEKCQYDQHISLTSGGVLNLPEEFEEVEESTFVYLGTSVTGCIEKLIKKDIKFNQDFQVFIESSIGVFNVNGMTLNNYMLQTYPNSVI